MTAGLVFAVLVAGAAAFLAVLARASRALSAAEVDWDAVEADVEDVLAESDLDAELADLIEREGRS